MLSFFTALADILGSVISMVIHVFSMILSMVQLLFSMFALLPQFLGFIPSFVGGFVMIMISISACLFIINHGSD